MNLPILSEPRKSAIQVLPISLVLPSSCSTTNVSLRYLFDLQWSQKPVELPERAVTNSSKAGDTVLDLFGGSGSTLIACEKLGRHARLMELDPKYCDVIVKRWEDFTGKKAQLSEL